MIKLSKKGWQLMPNKRKRAEQFYAAIKIVRCCERSAH